MGFFAGYSQDHLTNSSRPYVKVIDPGAPGKMDRLNLRFFWRRMYVNTQAFIKQNQIMDLSSMQ